MRINVYCRNLGWLFEDLKRQIAENGAIPSETPIPDADAYICIRTKEFSLSPKPDKTVVQVHDMTYTDVSGAGTISFCYPAQETLWRKSDKKTPSFYLPIGSRDIPITPLPERPTLGFFCREVKGSKGSVLLEESVKIARESLDFDVLMIGKNLEHIAHLGIYESRAAEIGDYQRITSFMTLNPIMVAISAYEALAAGRSVISTPREWTHNFYNIGTGKTAKELAANIVTYLKSTRPIPQKPFDRDEWCKRQVKEAINLI